MNCYFLVHVGKIVYQRKTIFNESSNSYYFNTAERGIFLFSTIEIAKGVSLHIRQSTQFKTVNFSIKWRKPLTVKDAAERSVLSNVHAS